MHSHVSLLQLLLSSLLSPFSPPPFLILFLVPIFLRRILYTCSRKQKNLSAHLLNNSAADAKEVKKNIPIHFRPASKMSEILSIAKYTQHNTLIRRMNNSKKARVRCCLCAKYSTYHAKTGDPRCPYKPQSRHFGLDIWCKTRFLELSRNQVWNRVHGACPITS
jgi:hypothetical protein